MNSAGSTSTTGMVAAKPPSTWWIEQDLKPVFDAAPSNAWETPMQQYSTLSTREKMLECPGQGVAPPEIERLFVKAPMTVYRLIERLHDRETLGDH